MTRSARRAVVAAAVATLLVSLLDTNIVTAAAPSIATAFGPAALPRVPWLVSSYAVAEMVTQPLYGKLADRYGPKIIWLAAQAVFLAGSILCGLAPSMTALIAVRVLQGIGAAGALSLTFVVFGRLNTAGSPDDAVSGNLAGGVLLAVGIVAGPLVGGALLAHADWRWIFWLNVPVTAAAIAVMLACLRLEAPAETADEAVDLAIDWPGALLLTLSAVAVQILCAGLGHAFSWVSLPALVTAGLAAAAGVGFVRRQRRVRHPFFPRRLLASPLLRRLTVLQLVAGLGLATAFYLPVGLQLVRGFTPLRAGTALIPLAVGVVLGAVAATLLVKFGWSIRRILILGTGMAACALALLAAVLAAPILLVWGVLIIEGGANGLTLGNELALIRDAVSPSDLGIATAGVRFVETTGAALGSAAFGLVFARLLSTGTHTAGSAHLACTVIFGAGAIALAVGGVAAWRVPDRPSTATMIESVPRPGSA